MHLKVIPGSNSLDEVGQFANGSNGVVHFVREPNSNRKFASSIADVSSKKTLNATISTSGYAAQ